MANNYGNEQVRCPFFAERQDKTEIRCKGILPEIPGLKNQVALMEFSNEAGKDRWLTYYCTGFAFNGCPYYRFLETLWEVMQGGEKR